VLVLPRTERVSWLGEGGRAGRETAGRSGHEPWGASDVDGLREYRPGTPGSRIHWPALARGAGLLERRLIADEGRLPLVVLDSRACGRAELLDAAVRAAASLSLELARRGGCELLLPGDRRPLRVGPDLAGWPGAHVRLALVSDGTRAPGLPRGPAGPVFWVAAGLDSPTGPSLPGRGRAEVVLVVPDALAGGVAGAPRFAVAGCCGFAITPRSASRPRRAA